MRTLTRGALVLALLVSPPVRAQAPPDTTPTPEASGTSTLGSPPPAPERVWTGFDQDRYRLVRDEEGYRLVDDDGSGIPVPLGWLEPPEVMEAERGHYVSSLLWDEEVTSFPVGGGRVGLHLSSYAIQESGSAAAAAGRDQLLILDPATGELFRGLELADSKGRVRIGGCFSAHFHRLAVGDVDCDRRLDVAVTEERVGCIVPEGELDSPVYRIRPWRWYLQRGDAWTPAPELDGRLPCAGLADLPLVGIVLTPVQFVLERYSKRPPLLPSPRR